MKLNFKKIFIQSSIKDNPVYYNNANIILSRFPEAEIQEVSSHWNIDELVQASPNDWLKNKKDILVLGIKSSMTHKVNGRSADFIASSISNGCLSSCMYCYVARQKGGSNPLTIFVNIEQIANSIERHQKKLGPKIVPNQCDSTFWTYDIGCNSDLSLDALICEHPGYLVNRFAKMQYAKATFATKTVNEDFWLRFDPQKHTRIRYSLMPSPIARYVDIGTSPIPYRVKSVNNLVEAGYEVHLNFSPIILYKGDEWKQNWLRLFQEINDILSPKAKEQLACEAFFLSHSSELHENNLQWNSVGESYLWDTKIQVPKRTKPDVLVYDYAMRSREIDWFKSILKIHLPYCKLRYSF